MPTTEPMDDQEAHKVADRFGFDVEYPADGPRTAAGRNILDHWEEEGGPDPDMVRAIVKIEEEAAALGPRADSPSPEGAEPRTCMGCGQAADGFSTGCMEHAHDGLCQRCVNAIRSEPTVVRIHHGDPDSYARAFNEGFDTALEQEREAALPEPHPDAGRLDRNHYDRFTAGEADDVLHNLDAWREKYEEALTDPFVHDHAKVTIVLIDEIRRLAALPEPSLEALTKALAYADRADDDASRWYSGEVTYMDYEDHARAVIAGLARLRGTEGSHR